VAQALRTVARSPVDNLAQSVDGGHSLRLHPGRPPPGPGCPPPPYNGGHAPRTPRSASRRPTFWNFPEARKPPGARRRAWTTASGCPPPPPAHPCPEPLRLG